MKSLTMDDLLLLPESEAVQTHFDQRNYAVFRRLLVVCAVWAFGATVAGIIQKDVVLLGAAVANLLSVLTVFTLRESRFFLRHFRYVALIYLLLQLFFIVLSTDRVETAVNIAGFIFPLLLLLLRLRISEYLLLLAAFLAVTLALLYRQTAGTDLPLFNDTFGGAASMAGVVLVVAATITARQRRSFLADWRRDHTRHRERLRLREEIEYARRIQVGMLPQAPPALPWIDVSAVSLPATEVGGDYYDYFELSPDRLALVIGDVAGHGLASGLLLSGVRSCLYLLEDDLADPVAVLGRLHRMVRRTTDPRTFVTLLCAVLDRAEGTLTVASAGHPPVLHRRAGAGCVEEVGEGAPPLGTGLPGIYVQVVRPLGPGDLLVFYTDGLLEAADPFSRLYGEERLAKVIQRTPAGAPARAVREAILEDLSRFKGGSEQLDDLTLVAVRMR